jgi:hypothetical protein
MREPNTLRPWTVDRVVAELHLLGPLHQREPLEALSGQRDALSQALRRALQACDGPARPKAAAMLLKLQDPAGRDAFLEALRGTTDAVREALSFLCLDDLAPHDTNYKDRYDRQIKIPISGAEIFAAISRYLREPQSELGRDALFICLKHDIEASRVLTRGLLEDSSGALRLRVADWYLRHGRDDGALRVLDELYEVAMSNPENKDPRWSDLKTSWFNIRDCCRSSAEPLRTEAARMAMRIVRKTLKASDWRSRTHVNDGFVNIGLAAEAIASVMPDGAEALLEEIIAGSFDCLGSGDDYGRGQAIIALAGATGERSRSLVRACLDDAAVRKYAATALGGIAKGTNDPDDIAALADAFSKEDRPAVIDSILTALAGIGPDAEPHVKAAIKGATPWTRMELHWQHARWSARQIADMLTEAGVIDPIDDAALAEATQGGVDLLALLWAGGKRLALMDSKCDSVPPPHHSLFKALLDIARPKITIEDLSQSDTDNYRREPVAGLPGVVAQTDLGTICTVSFAHGGVVHKFNAQPSGRWLDVPAVMEGFNRFMTAIGREDRCFQLAMGGSHCLFLVAPITKFRKVAERLHIPLEPDADRARREGIAYVRQVVGGE